MERLTVKQLAKLSGVRVRMLHHYDGIGLLKPGVKSESRYRYYGDREAFRLQQILLYREIDHEQSHERLLQLTRNQWEEMQVRRTIERAASGAGRKCAGRSRIQ